MLSLFNSKKKRRRSVKRVGVGGGGNGSISVNGQRRSPPYPMDIINIDEKTLPLSPTTLTTRREEKMKMKEVLEEMPMTLPTLSVKAQRQPEPPLPSPPPHSLSPSPPPTPPPQLNRVPSRSPAIELDFTHESLLKSFPSELLRLRQGSSSSSLGSNDKAATHDGRNESKSTAKAPSIRRRRAPTPLTMPKAPPTHPFSTSQKSKSVVKQSSSSSAVGASRRSRFHPSLSRSARHPYALDFADESDDDDDGYSTLDSMPDSTISGLTLARGALSSLVASPVDPHDREAFSFKSSPAMKSDTGSDYGRKIGALSASGAGSNATASGGIQERDMMVTGRAQSGSRRASRHRLIRGDSATLPPEDVWRKDVVSKKSSGALSLTSRAKKTSGSTSVVAVVGSPLSLTTVTTPGMGIPESESRFMITSKLEARSPDSANPPGPPAKDNPPVSATSHPQLRLPKSTVSAIPGRVRGHTTDSSVSTIASISVYSATPAAPHTPITPTFGTRINALIRRPSGPRSHNSHGQSSGSKTSSMHSRHPSAGSISAHSPVALQSTATTARLAPQIVPPPSSPLPSTPEEPFNHLHAGFSSNSHRTRLSILDIPGSVGGNAPLRRISRISERSSPSASTQSATTRGYLTFERQHSERSSNVEPAVSAHDISAPLPERDVETSAVANNPRKTPPIQTDRQATTVVDAVSPVSDSVASPSVYSSSSVQSAQVDENDDDNDDDGGGGVSPKPATALSSPSVYSSHASHKLLSPEPPLPSISLDSQHNLPAAAPGLPPQASRTIPHRPPRNVTSIPVDVTASMLVNSPFTNQFEKVSAEREVGTLDRRSAAILDDFQFIPPTTNMIGETTTEKNVQEPAPLAEPSALQQSEYSGAVAQAPLTIQSSSLSGDSPPSSPPPAYDTTHSQGGGSSTVPTAPSSAPINSANLSETPPESRSTDSIAEATKSVRSVAESSPTASSVNGTKRNKPIPLKALASVPGVSALRSPTGSMRSIYSINMLPIGERRGSQIASPDLNAHMDRKRPTPPPLTIGSDSPLQGSSRGSKRASAHNTQFPESEVLIPEGNTVSPISATRTGIVRRSSATPEELSIASTHGSKKYTVVQGDIGNEDGRDGPASPPNDMDLVQTFPETPEAFSPAFSDMHSHESGTSSRISSVRLSKLKLTSKRHSKATPPSSFLPTVPRPPLPTIMTDTTTRTRTKSITRSASSGSLGHLSAISSGTSIISPLQPPPTPPPSIPTTPFSQIQLPVLIPLTAPLMLNKHARRPPLPIGPRDPNRSTGSREAPKTAPGHIDTQPIGLVDKSVHEEEDLVVEQEEQSLTEILFQRSPLRWRGYGLEAARLKFTQKEMQEIVSRSIRQSGDPSSIRLLPLEVLDSELPDTLRGLESRRTDVCNSYKALVRKREMLMGSIKDYASMQQPQDSIAIAQLVTQLSEVTSSCDRLTEELYTISDQIEQTKQLLSNHDFSSLALAARKINDRYIKQIEEVRQLRAEIVDLYVDRERGWNQAQSIAQELEELNEKFATTSTSTDGLSPGKTPSGSGRVSRVSMARKGSLRMSRTGVRLSIGRRSTRSSYSSLRVNVSNSARSTFSADDLVPPVPPIPYRNFLSSAGERDGPLSLELYTGGATSAEHAEMQKAQQELLDILGIPLDEFDHAGPATSSRPQSELIAVSRPNSPIPINIRRVSSHRSSLRQSQPVRLQRKLMREASLPARDGNWI